MLQKKKINRLYGQSEKSSRDYLRTSLTGADLNVAGESTSRTKRGCRTLYAVKHVGKVGTRKIQFAFLTANWKKIC